MLLGVSSPDSRAALCRSLASHGHEVLALPDGYHLTECLADAILSDGAERPALIIVNPVLPGCTGQSLLAGLRELGWDTPMIALVEHGDDPGARPGATATFVEPVDLDVFADYVDSVVEPGEHVVEPGGLDVFADDVDSVVEPGEHVVEPGGPSATGARWVGGLIPAAREW